MQKRAGPSSQPASQRGGRAWGATSNVAAALQPHVKRAFIQVRFADARPDIHFWLRPLIPETAMWRRRRQARLHPGAIFALYLPVVAAVEAVQGMLRRPEMPAGSSAAVHAPFPPGLPPIQGTSALKLHTDRGQRLLTVGGADDRVATGALDESPAPALIVRRIHRRP
jgi:hypothetical protein